MGEAGAILGHGIEVLGREEGDGGVGLVGRGGAAVAAAGAGGTTSWSVAVADTDAAALRIR